MQWWLPYDRNNLLASGGSDSLAGLEGWHDCRDPIGDLLPNTQTLATQLE